LEISAGGFLLFRLFDIWKPYPIKKFGEIAGRLGIMADDWLAGVYAAICCVPRYTFGLV